MHGAVNPKYQRLFACTKLLWGGGGRDVMIIGEADSSPSRPIATGTYNNLVRLFKTFRQHVDPMEDAEDAKEYNVLHKSIAKRVLERQNEEEEDYLYGPLEHHLVLADDHQEEQSGAPPLGSEEEA